MSSLHDALELMDKPIEPLRGEEQYQARKAIEKAAPAALAWIKEALPWLEAYSNQQHLANMHGYQYDVSALDALIAQAKQEGLRPKREAPNA